MEDFTQLILPYTLSTVFYLVISFALADVFYRFLLPAQYTKLPYPKKIEWRSNAASLPNSLLAGIGSLVGITLTNYLSATQQYLLMKVIVTSMTGYFSCDFIYRLVLFSKTEAHSYQIFYMVHHVIGIYAVQVAVMFPEMFMAKFLFLVMELSNVFVNVRFMILDSNVERASNLYTAIAYLMVIFFFVTRVVPIPFEIYLVAFKCTYLAENCHGDNRWFMTSNIAPYAFFTLANLYFFYRMVRGLVVQVKIRNGTAPSTYQKCISNAINNDLEKQDVNHMHA